MRQHFGRCSVESVAVGVDGHLRHYREVTDLTGGTQRLTDLGNVAESLQDYEVDSSGNQRLDDFPEVGTGFVDRGRPVRLDADAQRSDRAGHVHVVADRFSGNGGGATGYLGHFAFETVGRELYGIGGVCVGLDYLGAGTRVFPVDGGHQLRVGEIQLVE